jgi:hypothetical protein
MKKQPDSYHQGTKVQEVDAASVFFLLGVLVVEMILLLLPFGRELRAERLS